MTILVAEVTAPVWQNTINFAWEIAPRILWAIGILLLTRLAISLVSRFLRRGLNRTEPTLRKFLIQAAEILTLVIGVLAALNQLQIETASLVTVLGAAGIAIGLALQNTLSHFAAGVMLISLRPFEVGDSIEGAGVAGIVDGIGIFSTTLVTPDNVKITVPNSNLFTGTLKNTTALGTRRVDLEIEIGDCPIEPTITKLLALVQSHPLVLSQPTPQCQVASISPKGTVLYLRPWCQARTYDQVRSEVQKLVKEAVLETPPSTEPGEASEQGTEGAKGAMS